MRRRLRNALVAAAVLLLLIVPTVVEFYTDWLWFLEVGHEQVFLRTLNSRLARIRSTSPEFSPDRISSLEAISSLRISN